MPATLTDQKTAKKTWEKIIQAIQRGSVQQSLKQASTGLPKQMWDILTYPGKKLAQSPSRPLDPELTKSLQAVGRFNETAQKGRIGEKYKDWYRTVESEPSYAETYAQEVKNAWNKMGERISDPVRGAVKKAQEKFWGMASTPTVSETSTMEKEKEMDTFLDGIKNNKEFSHIKNLPEQIMKFFIAEAGAGDQIFPNELKSYDELMDLLKNDPAKYEHYKNYNLGGIDPILYVKMKEKSWDCLEDGRNYILKYVKGKKGSIGYWGANWTDVKAECGRVKPKYVEPPPPPPPPPPPDERDRCYRCNASGALEVRLTNLAGECEEGWSKDEPTCEVPVDPPEDTITCYQCMGENLTTTIFSGTTCPENYSATPLDCTIEPPPPPPETITCYKCDGPNLITQEVDGTSCPSGWSSETLTCEEELPDQPEDVPEGCVTSRMYGMKPYVGFSESQELQALIDATKDRWDELAIELGGWDNVPYDVWWTGLGDPIIQDYVDQANEIWLNYYGLSPYPWYW